MSVQGLLGVRCPVTLSRALQNVKTVGAQWPNPPAESMRPQTRGWGREREARHQLPGALDPAPPCSPGVGDASPRSAFGNGETEAQRGKELC